ncbi:MlaA family lipoprotein [Thiosulfativibrio zosterae]|uniref:Phospholipid-binding lipoprotein MlaA n=1 Tax=Thiosulfativibrio zosterae TaxID=2675053 RepID=A0A6F8PJR7_9GAMM|nr:VacJ family lipoprotein [Thiosulfativibrio zosterae]BBP42304.1 phospholipid-binding lipoprotein MlaA [Thiosulfativibrio zosterae]
MKFLQINLMIFSSLVSLPNFAAESKPMNSQDPFESYNRTIYDFNVGFNDLIGEPVAKAYINYVPDPAKTGLDNFFSNLKEPINMLNSFLQGKGEAGFTSLMRFSINTVFGLGGLLDIATPARLVHQKEDLGQTLYRWGVWNEASFVMIPFIGPYTTRELVGGLIDSGYDPTYPYVIKTDQTGRAAFFVGDKFISYTKVVNLTAEMKQQPDPYIFMRESYLQYRTNLIYDGKAPQPKLDDFNFE